MSSTSTLAVITGLLFGLSLIVALGPQNTFVLQQGIRREHVLTIVAVCAVSDVVLIAAGVGGAGAVLVGRDVLIHVIAAIGIAFLVTYAALAARRALRPQFADAGPADPAPTTRRRVVLTCLAFTWLNPGVYVDTVMLVGPVSQSHGGDHWWFGVGAMIASVAWFAALGFAAGRLAPWFRSVRGWRILDASVAVVMAFTAVRLALAW